MTIHELVATFNTAATVLGYIVFTLILTFLVWVAGIWHDNWAYRRRRKRQHDIDWDNIRSKWLLELGDPTPNECQHCKDADTSRVITEVLDFPEEQFYTYLKEQNRDAS